MTDSTGGGPAGPEPGRPATRPSLRDLWARGDSGLRFILAFGVVSLFADFTYEGARSVSGPYLGLLGASAATVGWVAGLGEFLGYGLRLVSGWVVDRTGRYWLVTLVGYVINLLAVPALALAGNWEIAAFLFIAERAGKGLRNPPRDAMLSFAASSMGQGRGYGLHEAMDQAGAVAGPLLVALVLSLTGSHRPAFAWLLVPAVLALGVLLWIRRREPEPRGLQVEDPDPGRPNGGAGPGTGRGFLGPWRDFPRRFWIYLAGVSLLAAGFADFALVAFHFQAGELMGPGWIPVAYAGAMVVDAAGALAFGWLHDRVGPVPGLMVAALVSAAAAPALFLVDGPALLAVGLALWGVGMGAQESIMRAVVAEMIPPDRRGTAFGAFNAVYGLAWFVGSALLGILYETSLGLVVAVSAGLALLSLPVFRAAGRVPVRKVT